MNVSVVFGGSVELINYLHNRNIKFILVLSNDDYYDYKYINLAVECYILDFKKLNKLRAIIKIISDSYDVDGIISWDDNTIEISSIIAKELGLKSINDFSAKTVHDKIKFRDVLNSSEFNIYYKGIYSENDIKNVMNSLKKNHEYILKPVYGTGSTKIFKVNTDNFNDVGSNFSKEDFPLILEEFIEGYEVSVETFSYKGEHHIIGITEKIKDPTTFIEYGHKFPMNVEKENYELIQEKVNKFLDIIKHNEGPAHTELIIYGKDIKIIESHTRIGGDFISELIKYSKGIDLYKEYVDYFLYDKEPNFSNKFSEISEVIFIKPKKGKVKQINGEEFLRNNSQIKSFLINIKEGDELLEDRSSFDRKGHIIISAKNERELQEIKQLIEKKVNIIME